MTQTQCSRVSRVDFFQTALIDTALVSPRWAGPALAQVQHFLLIEETQRNGTGGTSIAKRAPTGPALVNCPFSRKGRRRGRLHHSPGSNLTTKRQRIKVARRLFLKGRERRWLTAESQSRRSNISSDRNLWEESGQGDRA